MSDIAISVQNLSKHYSSGAAQERHVTAPALLCVSQSDAMAECEQTNQ